MIQSQIFHGVLEVLKSKYIPKKKKKVLHVTEEVSHLGYMLLKEFGISHTWKGISMWISFH